MITINTNKINTLNQKIYNELINSIDFNRLICSCGHAACLTKHGYYKRSIKGNSPIKTTILVLRTKCSICGKTHAIIPTTIIPYSQVPLDTQIAIIGSFIDDNSKNFIMIENPLIDESNISYIIKNYKKYWRERLIVIGINIKDTLETIVSKCISHFNKTFMQNKYTPIIYFDITHIT